MTKRHAGSPGSTTREERRAAAKKKDRERRVRRGNNVLTKNTSLDERARRRGEDTDVESGREIPLFSAIRRMRGNG